MALWAPGGRENVRGQVDVTAPEGVREFVGDLLGALPDLSWEIVSTTTEGDRCAVQWRFVGTFAGPGTFGGLAPTGHPLVLEGVDLLTVRDGLIQSNEAFTDTMDGAAPDRMMPPLGSHRRTADDGRVQRQDAHHRPALAEPELVAEGVWVVQGQPGRCNVYLIEDEGGVTLFDAGARTMVRAVAAAGARLGRIRGWCSAMVTPTTAARLPRWGSPCCCHPNEVQDAEGSGGCRYWPQGLVGPADPPAPDPPRAIATHGTGAR